MLFNLMFAVLASVSAVNTAPFTSGTPTARSGSGEKKNFGQPKEMWIG